jgi:hypothetical protein
MKDREQVQKAEEVMGFSLRVYTPEDYPNIHRQLKKYWNGDRFDKEKFMVDCGALSETGAVIVKNYSRSEDGEIRFDRPTRYEQANNLLAWYIPARFARRDYAIEQQAIEIAEKHSETEDPF